LRTDQTSDFTSAGPPDAPRSPRKELLGFFNAHAIPEEAHVAVAILWPNPVSYHVPATPENLSELARLSENCAFPELAVHFHVYRAGKVLLEWHDAFTQPMLLDGSIPEGKVSGLAQVLSMKTTKWKDTSNEALEAMS